MYKKGSKKKNKKRSEGIQEKKILKMMMIMNINEREEEGLKYVKKIEDE